MKKKTKTAADAERKQWRAELQTLTKAKRAVLSEGKKVLREVATTLRRIEKTTHDRLAKIEHRAKVLKSRLGR